MKKTRIAVTAVALAGTLTACTPPKLPPTSQSELQTGRPDIRSPGTKEMADCKREKLPSRAIQIEFTDPKIDSMRNLGVKIVEMPVTTTNPYGDPTQSTPPPEWPNHVGTKFDLNLALLNPDTTNRRNRVYIIVKLDDQTARFVDEHFAITSLDSKGPKMFCKRADYFKDPHLAIFEAKYWSDPDSSSDGKTHGTFNINLILDDQDGTHIVPISIDPEVKNEG